MRKIISMLLVMVFVFTLVITTAHAAALTKFKDVPAGSWYEKYVSELVAKKIIDGFTPTKFGPADNLKVAQCIKMVVSALGYTNLKYYTGYVDKAKKLGLVTDEEFPDKKNLERNITRGEIARLIVRALTKEVYPANLDSYKTLITDYNSINADIQDYVLKCRYLGIVSGYSDGRFVPSDLATRAQATKMILCMIDKSVRIQPTFEIKQNGYTIPKSTIIGVDAQKNDTINHTDIDILIFIVKDMNKQFSETKDILDSKFGKDNSTVKDIISYARTKTDRWTKLSLKIYNIDNQKIYVGGQDLTISITVYQQGF